MFQSLSASLSSVYSNVSAGPKAWLSRYIAKNLLFEYLDIEDARNQIEANLLSDTRIRLQNTRVKPIRLSQDYSCVVTGSIKFIEFSWKWGSGSNKESSPYIHSVQLTIAGIRLSVKAGSDQEIQEIISSAALKNSSQSLGSKSIVSKDDDATAQDWTSRYLQQVLDHLTLVLTDTIVVIHLPCSGKPEMLLTLQLANAELKTLQEDEQKASAKRLSQRIALSLLSASASNEMGDAVLLLEPFSYSAGVIRVSGRRFLDGVIAGLEITGEDQHDSEDGNGATFHFGETQANTLWRLCELVGSLSAEELSSPSASFESSSTQTEAIVTNEATENKSSLIILPLHHVRLILDDIGSILTLNCVKAQFRSDGSQLRLQGGEEGLTLDNEYVVPRGSAILTVDADNRLLHLRAFENEDENTVIASPESLRITLCLDYLKKVTGGLASTVRILGNVSSYSLDGRDVTCLSTPKPWTVKVANVVEFIYVFSDETWIKSKIDLTEVTESPLGSASLPLISCRGISCTSSHGTSIFVPTFSVCPDGQLVFKEKLDIMIPRLGTVSGMVTELLGAFECFQSLSPENASLKRETNFYPFPVEIPNVSFNATDVTIGSIFLQIDSLKGSMDEYTFSKFTGTHTQFDVITAFESMDARIRVGYVEENLSVVLRFSGLSIDSPNVCSLAIDSIEMDALVKHAGEMLPKRSTSIAAGFGSLVSGKIRLGLVREARMTSVGRLKEPLGPIIATFESGEMNINVGSLHWIQENNIKSGENSKGARARALALPIPLGLSCERLFLLRDLGERGYGVDFVSEECLLHLLPDSSGGQRSSDVEVTVRRMKNIRLQEMFAIDSLTHCNFRIDPAQPSRIKELDISLDTIVATADFSSQGWSDSLQESDAQVFNLPFASISEMNLVLRFKHHVLSVEDATLYLKPFRGDAGTDTETVTNHYVGVIKERVPFLLTKANVLGVNIGDSIGSAVGTAVLSSSLTGSVLGVVGRDAVGGAISQGKKSRGAGESERYHFGDISRGVASSFRAAARAGTANRGGDKYQIGDFSAGTAAASSQYVSENKERLSSAAGSSLGMMAGLALAGPVGLVAGAVVGGRAAAAAVRSPSDKEHERSGKKPSERDETSTVLPAQHVPSTHAMPHADRLQTFEDPVSRSTGVPNQSNVALGDQPLWDDRLATSPPTGTTPHNSSIHQSGNDCPSLPPHSVEPTGSNSRGRSSFPPPHIVATTLSAPAGMHDSNSVHQPALQVAASNVSHQPISQFERHVPLVAAEPVPVSGSNYRFGDITRGVVALGKQKRGADSKEGYKFGDFTRGLFGK